MVQGPGAHLKLAPKGLPAGITPETFDYFHELVVHEERSRTMCPGFDDGLDAACSIGLPVVIKYGDQLHKDLCVASTFRGETNVALAISEAFAGSDVAALRTRGQLDAKGENYIVNGTKKWITGG